MEPVATATIDRRDENPARMSAWRARADRLLALITEVPAAILIVFQTALLFVSVVARYVFHQPVIWSDELAAILFLWLAMLGSTIALRRGAHMRLTLFVNRASPAMRSWIEVTASLVIALFIALVIGPAAEYAADERFITTPALQVANSWRTGGDRRLHRPNDGSGPLAHGRAAALPAARGGGGRRRRGLRPLAVAAGPDGDGQLQSFGVLLRLHCRLHRNRRAHRLRVRRRHCKLPCAYDLDAAYGRGEPHGRGSTLR